MQPGQIIANRYAIERLAGSGGMGAVYCAVDRQTGARVAIKVLHGHGADHAARFAREARLLSELQHPGIVRYLDHGATDAGDGFIAMEWLEGEDLSARIKREGPLAIPEVLTLAAQVASALRGPHARGIVHRDLKPANLFLEGGSIGRVKILDFGLARALQANTRITASGEMLGTPGYMSPEQARGEREIDARSDVFSLGCILFRCVTGRKPFRAPDPLSVLLKTLSDPVPRLRELRDDVPPALDELVDRMLAKSPAERPRDAGAVLEQLQAITGAAPAKKGIEKTWDDPHAAPRLPPAPPAGPPAWAPPAQSTAPLPPPSYPAPAPSSGAPRWSHPAALGPASGAAPVVYPGPAPVDAPRPSSNLNMLLALGVGAVLLMALLGLLIIVVFSAPSGGSLPQRSGTISGPARP